MKAQDKQRPVALTVKLHPEILRTARALGEFYEGSDVEHIVGEAVKDAAKDKKFAEWWLQHPEAGSDKPEEKAPGKTRKKGALEPVEASRLKGVA
jgi:hypothetical protein